MAFKRKSEYEAEKANAEAMEEINEHNKKLALEKPIENGMQESWTEKVVVDRTKTKVIECKRMSNGNVYRRLKEIVKSR